MCLKPKCSPGACPIKGNCFNCEERHHVFLCLKKKDENLWLSTSTSFNAAIQCTNTLMAYDVCQVNNEINNKNISVFCQYDGGSTDNFILSSLANNLELSCQNVKLF